MSRPVARSVRPTCAVPAGGALRAEQRQRDCGDPIRSAVGLHPGGHDHHAPQVGTELFLQPQQVPDVAAVDRDGGLDLVGDRAPASALDDEVDLTVTGLGAQARRRATVASAASAACAYTRRFSATSNSDSAPSSIPSRPTAIALRRRGLAPEHVAPVVEMVTALKEQCLDAVADGRLGAGQGDHGPACSPKASTSATAKR